jgi:hypothetical protein
MSRDNKREAHRHGVEAQSNSRALPGASTGLEVVCARRMMLAIQDLAIRVGRNRTAKLHRVPAIPQRLGAPGPFDPQLSSRVLGTRPEVGRVGLRGNHPLPDHPGRRMASADRRAYRLRQLGGGGVTARLAAFAGRERLFYACRLPRRLSVAKPPGARGLAG